MSAYTQEDVVEWERRLAGFTDYQAVARPVRLEKARTMQPVEHPGHGPGHSKASLRSGYANRTGGKHRGVKGGGKSKNKKVNVAKLVKGTK